MSHARTVALAAYHAAVAAPVAADWPSVAALLVACLPKLRAAPKPAVSADGAVPAWWHDYVPGKRYVPTSADVEFADGRTIRVTIASNPGKPLNIGRAIRTAVAFYRARVHADMGAPRPSYESTVTPWNAHVAVPAIESVHVPSTGMAFCPLDCSRMTAELRAGTWGADDAPADPAAALASYVAAWRAAYQAGEDAVRTDGTWRVAPPASETDCERMARMFGGTWRLDADGKAMRVHAAPGIVWTGEGEQYGNDSDYEAGAAVERAEALAEIYRRSAIPTRVDHEASRAADREAHAEARAAAWCEAVADGYGQPGAFVIGETWEAGADAPEAAAAPSPVKPDPAPVPPVAAPIALPAPVEAVAHPPVGIADVSAPVGIPSSDPADAMSDAWEPTAESHPVIAVCLSDKARSALFDMILDGTFPARPPVTKGGSWHLTLADALACQGLPSVRFVGLPRKPYTRRHAPEAIAA
jgi:hypothetical protein